MVSRRLFPFNPLRSQGNPIGEASDDSDAGGDLGPCRGPLYAEAATMRIWGGHMGNVAWFHGNSMKFTGII